MLKILIVIKFLTAKQQNFINYVISFEILIKILLRYYMDERTLYATYNKSDFDEN